MSLIPAAIATSIRLYLPAPEQHAALELARRSMGTRRFSLTQPADLDLARRMALVGVFEQLDEHTFRIPGMGA